MNHKLKLTNKIFFYIKTLLNASSPIRKIFFKKKLNIFYYYLQII